MALAMTSLPVPVSPSMKTVESVGATMRTRSSVSIRALLHPTIPSDACSSERFSLTKLVLAKLCACGKAMLGLPIHHPPTRSLFDWGCFTYPACLCQHTFTPFLHPLWFRRSQLPCPTANFRLVLCRSGRACNLRASRLPSLLEQESAIRVQATAPSITSNSCVRSGPVTEYTAPN